jgi:hypothetical protein
VRVSELAKKLSAFGKNTIRKVSQKARQFKEIKYVLCLHRRVNLVKGTTFRCVKIVFYGV